MPQTRLFGRGLEATTRQNGKTMLFQPVVGNEVKFAINTVFEGPTRSMGYILAQELLSVAISQITREGIHLS